MLASSALASTRDFFASFFCLLLTFGLSGISSSSLDIITALRFFGAGDGAAVAAFCELVAPEPAGIRLKNESMP